MLRNVFRKIFCLHRLRLASLTFLTALIIASYLLVFLHLESLVQIKESGFHGLVRNAQPLPPLCGEFLVEKNAWKNAAASVLMRLKISERKRIEELLGSRDNKKFVDERLEAGDHQDAVVKAQENINDKNERLSSYNIQKVDVMISNLEEVLDRICFEYTKSIKDVKYFKSKVIQENLPLVSSRDDSSEDIGTEDSRVLRSVIEDIGSLREEVLGSEDERLKRMKSSRRWYLNIHRDVGSIMPAWKIFQNRISQFSLYEDDEDLALFEGGRADVGRRGRLADQLIRDLSSLGINSIDEVSGLGTQLKYIFNFEDGSRALFKPMRVPRDAEESLDTYYMYEKERHTSEIAAFHLDRILGFRRVPPAAGRLIDMIGDLQVYLGPHSKKKFYLSPVGNQCFFGKCLYYCDPAHGVCGQGRMLEGSFVAFLPNKSVADWSSIKNPWIRSYSKHNRSFWEKETDGAGVCAMVKSQPPFNEWSSLLNVIDVHIFDFLIGNKDRHHFHFFTKFGNNSNFVLIDNGKGFGRYSHDIIDILAPLYQCCMIRYTTLKRLFAFHSNPKERLSRLMKQSLSADVLQDILTPAHLRALDRRVKIILQQVVKCIGDVGDPGKVVIDDDVIHDSPRDPP